MNVKALCQWLGLPEQAWPPDHYTLLGLPRGEADLAHIEERVQERMACLRCYQLSHPEEATEAMNRVAQAFICLTETQSRRDYDRTLNPPAPTSNGSSAPPSPAQLTPPASDWQSAPPPVRAAQEEVVPLLPAVAPASAGLSVTEPFGSAGAAVTAASPGPPTVPAALVPEVVAQKPRDPIEELAQHSFEARRGLATLPAVIGRIDQTRQLLLVWRQAGKYLSNPARRLTRITEENDLTRRLRRIFELMEGYPKILGHPGMPGYRVVAMARLEMTAEMFKMLDPVQRRELARDWKAGQQVLLWHRKYLRKRFRELRRRSLPSRVVHAGRTLINDHPILVGCAALLVALACAWWFWSR